jgi:predicted  nucleic acid-binding Zn-ribbon protein
MSSIGKIFVIVNLLLAVLVLGAAGALLKRTDVTQQQYKDAQVALETAKTELETARSDFAAQERTLTSDKAKLSQDKDSADVARQTAENKATKLEADNQQLRDDVTQIKGTLQTFQTNFSTTEQRVQELTDQNSQFRQQMMDAKQAANDADKAKSEAESKTADAERQVTELQGQLDKTKGDLSTANKLVEVAKAQGVDVKNVIAMPRIDATVAEVDDQYGFVVLDKGKKDNVERGFTFDIHRDGKYLGRVKVDQIYDNYSTARIEIKAPDAKMQRMDKASTYLD